jgi:hypothetical protein
MLNWTDVPSMPASAAPLFPSMVVEAGEKRLEPEGRERVDEDRGYRSISPNQSLM